MKRFEVTWRDKQAGYAAVATETFALELAGWGIPDTNADPKVRYREMMRVVMRLYSATGAVEPFLVGQPEDRVWVRQKTHELWMAAFKMWNVSGNKGEDFRVGVGAAWEDYKKLSDEFLGGLYSRLFRDELRTFGAVPRAPEPTPPAVVSPELSE